MTQRPHDLKVGIFIIAYRASQTLISAYKRIPTTLKRTAKEIYCFDDCSDDNTYYTGLGYKLANKIKNFSIYKNPINLGYGGNQKKGYSYAIKKGLDVVVMLHGDAQYAPEKIPLLLEPFNKKNWQEVGVVMGSRMMGKPLEGGMPLYKYVGNKILTNLENLILGTNLSEFHSGYRAFNMHALKNIQFKSCTNDFHFDTQILILLRNAGYKIIEVPIPTFYGFGSKSHVNVFKYGVSCLSEVIKFRLAQAGLFKKSLYSHVSSTRYTFKGSKYSSHMQISSIIHKLKIKKILDVGCGEGILKRALGAKWAGSIYGIDKYALRTNPVVPFEYNKIYALDLDSEDFVSKIKENNFDVIVMSDILEHLKRPDKILVASKILLKPKGHIIISIPNADFIPVKIIMLLFPKFRMSRGPLDRTHKVFYNYKKACIMLEKCNLRLRDVRSSSSISSILSLTPSFDEKNVLYRMLTKIDLLLIKIMPKYFSYQFIFLCDAVKVNEK